jgi:zinc transport system permease protein
VVLNLFGVIVMDVFQYDFMQRALIAGVITAIICPLIGIFVVVRRQSLIGDGLGHIAFAGVTGGYLISKYPIALAALVTAGAACGIEWLRRRHAQYSEIGLAIFFYVGMAMAIIFSTMTRMPTPGLLSFLFGSIITVTEDDLLIIGFCGIGVIAVIYWLFDKLMLMALDEDTATIAGVNATAINFAFSILTALVVVVGMKVVGILLVSALMIIPVAAADLLHRGFKVTLLWSVVFSVLAVLTGLLSSFYLDIAPGGTIVMTAVAIYALTSIGQRLLTFRVRH